MLLSVVIVNWNSHDDLQKCLQSLSEQTHQELEVIIVDNGSSDGSVAMVRKLFPSYHVLEETENLGFAEGCNRGISICNGPWVALLNNDTVADKNWAITLVHAAEKAPDTCGMLQSLMLFQQPPHRVNSTGIEISRSGGGRDRHDGQPRPPPGGPWEEIFCPTAGAAAYRRTMLEAIKLPEGYLDSKHFMYYEDTDLGWRARLAGWSAYYIPKSFVYHGYHASSDRHGKAWLHVIGHTNRVRTLLKNASLSFLLRTAPYTLEGLSKVLWHGGLRGGFQYIQAIRYAIAQRDQVNRLIHVPRRQIEKKWICEEPS